MINKHVPADALMVGVPARQIGWMSQYDEQLDLPLAGKGKVSCELAGAVYVLENGTLRVEV
ncbi:hypothetical protein RM532_03135 [Salinisphaera sp. W335]|uniref:Uncharacterized protein n=1 Tax=Spectribacter hydrogenoxidans TaxID=3075608 RepID=A0ABU3BX99_9GAMM|nr:hypothetical protein [Salinisphaera sp. W335]MDT0633947.1 hypothetical protein [Salinisphaera sp. W335]